MHKGFWLQCKYSICSLCMQGQLDLYLYARWYAQCVNLDNEMPRIEYQLHRFD